MKTLLVDDHAVVREGLKNILSRAFSTLTVVECGGGREAIDAITREDFDLVTLDLSLPQCDGMEVLRILRVMRPRLPVLVVSMHDEDQFAVNALRMGASGYLTKDAVAERLAEAARTLLSGEKYIGPRLAEKLAYALIRSPKVMVHEALSRRERQVLERLVLGKTVKEIGAELGLSVKTISSHRTRLLDKLDVHTTAELSQYAMKAHLVR